ncbi:hypothetical protein SAY87_000138 [Trapa incisa]|uniref:Uncharacterized protein n=1 Tax=Trapa incisa TaxID=236973 RepID=A0AAN7GT11_9MYRT|nr:hypothetical protein SAY87_000138 [Trapa incisa]
MSGLKKHDMPSYLKGKKIEEEMILREPASRLPHLDSKLPSHLPLVLLFSFLPSLYSQCSNSAGSCDCEGCLKAHTTGLLVKLKPRRDQRLDYTAFVGDKVGWSKSNNQGKLVSGFHSTAFAPVAAHSAISLGGAENWQIAFAFGGGSRRQNIDVCMRRSRAAMSAAPVQQLDLQAQASKLLDFPVMCFKFISDELGSICGVADCTGLGIVLVSFGRVEEAEKTIEVCGKEIQVHCRVLQIEKSILATLFDTVPGAVVVFLAAMEIMAGEFPGAFSWYSMQVMESHQSRKVDLSVSAKAVIYWFEKLGISSGIFIWWNIVEFDSRDSNLNHLKQSSDLILSLQRPETCFECEDPSPTAVQFQINGVAWRVEIIKLKTQLSQVPCGEMMIKLLPR